jgi:hypothetical protein
MRRRATEPIMSTPAANDRASDRFGRKQKTAAEIILETDADRSPARLNTAPR